MRRRRSQKAEPLLKRALAIYEKSLGPNHPDVGRGAGNLADFYAFQGRLHEVRPLLERSLAILEEALGPEHHHTIGMSIKLGELDYLERRYEARNRVAKRLLFRTKCLEYSTPAPGRCAGSYAKLLWKTNRKTQAVMLTARAIIPLFHGLRAHLEAWFELK